MNLTPEELAGLDAESLRILQGIGTPISFEEMQQGFINGAENSDFLSTRTEKSFEDMSAFKNSPFGQYWEKNIHQWAKPIFGPAKILDKTNIVIADLSSKVSHNQADFYNLLISKKNAKL